MLKIGAAILTLRYRDTYSGVMGLDPSHHNKLPPIRLFAGTRKHEHRGTQVHPRKSLSIDVFHSPNSKGMNYIVDVLLTDPF